MSGDTEAIEEKVVPETLNLRANPRPVTRIKAALPITETGYKSYFAPKGNIDEYETPAAFVKDGLIMKCSPKTGKWPGKMTGR